MRYQQAQRDKRSTKVFSESEIFYAHLPTAVLFDKNAQQLLGALFPGKPGHIDRRGSLSGRLERLPAEQGIGERLRAVAAEVVGVWAGDFHKYGQVAGDDGQLVLGGFDQRQAESFAFRSRQQGTGGMVQFDQQFVANTLKPVQVAAVLRVIVQALGQLVDHPALFADNDQVDGLILLPKDFAGGQSLGMALAGLDGTDHQQIGLPLQLLQGLLLLGGNAGAGRAGMNVGAEVKVANTKSMRLAAFCVLQTGMLGLDAQPGKQFVGNSLRDTDQTVCHAGDGVQPIMEVTLGVREKDFRAQHRQQVVDDEVDQDAAAAHKGQGVLVAMYAMDIQIKPQEDVVGVELNGTVHELHWRQAQELKREATRMAVATMIIVDRLDTVTFGRLVQQMLKHAAHHALNAGFEILLNQCGDVDPKGSGRQTGLVFGDAFGNVQDRLLIRRLRRISADQGLDQLLVVGARALCTELFNGLVIAFADMLGVVAGPGVGNSVLAQLLPALGFSAQAVKSFGELGIGKLVGELEHGVFRHLCGGTVVVDDRGQAVGQAVEDGGGGFAPALTAQLDSEVGSRQIAMVLLRADVAGDGDARLATAGGDGRGDSLTITGGLLAADKNETAAMVVNQGRVQPGLQQPVIKLGFSHQAKTANDEVFGMDGELFAGAVPVNIRGLRAQQRQADPVLGGLNAVVLRGQLPGKLGVHDDAGGLLQQHFVTGVLPDCRYQAISLMADEGLVTVGLVKHLFEQARLVALQVHIAEHAAEVKIMQDDDAGMGGKHGEHVAVVVGVAKVIDDTLIVPGMTGKPLSRMHGKVGHATGAKAFGLVSNDVDIIIARQLRQQYDTVIGDAGLLGRHRRNVGQARTQG